MALNPYVYGRPAPVQRNLYSGNAPTQQNSLYRSLQTQTPPPPAFTWDPNTTFGGQAGGPGDDTGVVSNPGGQYPHGTPMAPPFGSPQSGPAPTPTPSSGGGNSGGGYNFDFSGDPILARIRAFNAMNVANAESAALAQRKRAEIGYGYDPNLGAQFYEDPGTRAAAQQNQFSQLSQLWQNHDTRARNLDEGLNKANLFYGSEHARDIGLEGRQYTLEQSQTQGVLQNLMDQIAQGVLSAKNQAQQSNMQAESDAYDRAIQFALQYGTGGGGGGQGGLENASQFGNINGLSDEQLQAAAANYAAGRSYNGSPYTPGMVMQEGHVEVRNGVPGIYIKYHTAGGDSTEWTPIG